MGRFDHGRMEVYGLAITFIAELKTIMPRLERSHRTLADQLLRAACSIPLNIAEGAAEFSTREKARFYRFARRSAAECPAMVDVLAALDLLTPDRATDLHQSLGDIGAMLTGLIQHLERRRVHPHPSPRP